MSIILFDLPKNRSGLLPFTYTRPVAEIRIGTLKISEKWSNFLESEVSFLTDDYLQEKYPTQKDDINLVINSAIIPNDHLVSQILGLSERASLFQGDTFIATKCKAEDITHCIAEKWERFPKQEFNGKFTVIEKPWDIFRNNGSELRKDFDILTKGKISQPIIDPHTKVYNESNIFLEEGATVKAAILNAENGPIYLGKDSTVSEGAIIKGAFSLGEGSTVNMGAKMRGDITIGPACKVGGEVSNSILFGYSNKGHDGFLGNSVLGEWCNLGADTNTSNLKNNYTPVKVWDYQSGRFTDTGLQFCGLLMGDHAKSGINTMFNTGTTVGVCANVFGDGFPRTLIPSFAWGGAAGFSTFRLNKAFEAAEAMMKRRNKTLDEADKKILEKAFELSAQYRAWENKG